MLNGSPSKPSGYLKSQPPPFFGVSYYNDCLSAVYIVVVCTMYLGLSIYDIYTLDAYYVIGGAVSYVIMIFFFQSSGSVCLNASDLVNI